MEQLVRVQKRNTDGTVQVVHIRESACSGDCHKCSGCGAVKQEMVLTARDPLGVQPGQIVRIGTDSAPVLAAAAVLYVLPVMLFFAGYFLFHSLWQSGAAGGILAFALGIGIAAAYDRLVVKKQKTVYTVVGFGRDSDFTEKGDNDLD